MLVLSLSRCVFVFSLLAAFNVAAQELSIQKAIEESAHSSPKLQKAKASLDEVAWKKTEALSTFLPSVTAQATYLFDKKYLLTDMTLSPGAPVTSIPAVVPTSSVMVTGTLPIFEGGSGLKRYSSAGSFATAAEKEYGWTEFQLSREVILQFYKTLAAKELLEVSEQNLKT
ncbi:MAG: TolC family protein, partial [Proteobacteria bacterium]